MQKLHYDKARILMSRGYYPPHWKSMAEFVRVKCGGTFVFPASAIRSDPKSHIAMSLFRYLKKLKETESGSREIIILLLDTSADADDDGVDFTSLYSYFHSRQRIGVINTKRMPEVRNYLSLLRTNPRVRGLTVNVAPRSKTSISSQCRRRVHSRRRSRTVQCMARG